MKRRKGMIHKPTWEAYADKVREHFRDIAGELRYFLPLVWPAFPDSDEPLGGDFFTEADYERESTSPPGWPGISHQWTRSLETTEDWYDRVGDQQRGFLAWREAYLQSAVPAVGKVDELEMFDEFGGVRRQYDRAEWKAGSVSFSTLENAILSAERRVVEIIQQLVEPMTDWAPLQYLGGRDWHWFADIGGESVEQVTIEQQPWRLEDYVDQEQADDLWPFTKPTVGGTLVWSADAEEQRVKREICEKLILEMANPPIGSDETLEDAIRQAVTFWKVGKQSRWRGL